MMSPIRGQTGSLILLHLLLGVFLVLPEGGVCLELLPSASKVQLVSSSNFTVVCSGWSQVTWRLPRDTLVDGVVVVENQGSSSTLQLSNVTWKNSGRYTCEETSSYQSRDVDIFIPGQGPDEWFVQVTQGVVMKEAEEVTIPCVVSNPQLSVLLLERSSRTPVPGVYEPGRGFTGRLNDTSYVCLAAHGGEERESRVYYVFSIVVPQVMDVDLSASSSVLKQGEVLTVNCTVKDLDIVYFSWTFPRRQEVEPLTDFLPHQIRSFVNISMVTVADSGVYECEVQGTKQDQRMKKNITITVLERGYVYMWPSGDTNVSSLLHHTVALSVEIDALPPPTVLWTRANQSVAMETASVKTTPRKGSRYVSTLTLVRVQMDQAGSYTATVSNDDGSEEICFNLEVKAPPRITSLSEVGTKAVLCVSEGAPPPSVTWYLCHSSRRCGNVTDGWRSLSAASEGVSLQENISEVERGVIQVHSRLTLQALTSLSAVRCEVKNSAGRRVRDLRLLSPSLMSQVAVLAAVLVLVIIAVFFLIVLIVLWKKVSTQNGLQKPRYEVGWKLIESVSPDGKQYTYLDPSHLEYNSAWEIPRENIELGRVLGSGAFGRVVEGKVPDLIDSHSTMEAAVKMAKKNSGAAQSLMSELKVLVLLGPHVNIVNLLGACTSGRPVCLITEFCRHGDLVNFLQRNKHNFLLSDSHNKSDSDGGYMDMDKEREAADIEPAPHESPCAAPDQQEASSLLLNDSPLLSLNDLLSFSFQISQAMDFLSSRNCVHRDLAARNVQVCDGKLVKVCDFSLARDLIKDKDYTTRGNRVLPLKWMSPESVFKSIYNSQSDVWSYGVVLWEIFSLGESPYPDLPGTREFYSSLKSGHRMSRPEHAPHDIFQLMKRCWEEEPELRPPFSSLVVSIGNVLPEEHNKRYVRLTENFLKHPAVVRSTRSQARSTEEQTSAHGSPALPLKHLLLEVGTEEAGPSPGTYIIPISDIILETSGGAALDAASLHRSDTPQPQEVTSPDGKQEADKPSSSGCQEEDESCL